MSNVVWHQATIASNDRNKLLNQKPFVLWFTGLSASGKSTIANLVEQKLHQMEYNTYLLDGDNVRHGLNCDLGFDETSRIENIRRIGEVAKLFLDAGIITLTAFISPYKSDRHLVRKLFKEGQFLEVFIDSSIEVCENRDPKGLYAKARTGEIKKEGKNVWLAIRDVKPDEDNPWTAQEIEKMVHEGELKDLIADGRVITSIIPDIESVNYGRGVGYEIIEHIPPSEIGEISATSIREKMRKEGKL